MKRLIIIFISYGPSKLQAKEYFCNLIITLCFYKCTQDLTISNPDKWKDKPDLCRFTGSRGNIVNTSSTAGLGMMPEFSPYCASKWAVIGLTKSVAKEYAKEGIRINAVCPATTDTPMRSRFQEQWPEWQSETDAGYPVGRVAAPEEVAEAVYWLCSDSCPFVTGEYLKVSGGT